MHTQKTIATASAVLCACLLSACASHPWRITLKDGRQFKASSRPELQRKTGYYRYENENGRDALLRAEEVLMVEQM
jgi:hypothetical protein